MQRNLLLAALPTAEQQRLQPFLTQVELDLDALVIPPNEPIRYVYFPETLVTSTLNYMEDGSSVEAGLMGIEGCAGIQVWLHQNTTPVTTIVQVPGRAQRMSSHDFINQVRDANSPLNPLIARYINAFLIMTSQVAACNRLHELDARLCRWLSMIVHRVGTEFPMRHEFLAQMLGVRRATVSTTAKILQKAGLIDYSRGNMQILDVEGLRNGSCECLEIIEAQVDAFADTSWSYRKPTSAKRVRVTSTDPNGG
jgi:Crp-like helix-turn-helix protein